MTDLVSNYTNKLNTDFIDSVIGFTMDDITSMEPFKNSYSTAWFAVFVVFMLTIISLFAFAFLFSFCECAQDCCCNCSRNRKVEEGRTNDMAMH